MFRSFFNIYLYIYIYIEKRTEHSVFFCKRTKRSCVLLRSLQKNVAFFAYFYVLCVLFHSLEKNGKEQNIILGLISRPKLKKRTEKNFAFFLNGKERGSQHCRFTLQYVRVHYSTVIVNLKNVIF